MAVTINSITLCELFFMITAVVSYSRGSYDFLYV